MKKVLISLLVIGVVSVGAYMTISYFSDSETSTNNTFTAGAIDLQIQNDSYYNGQVNEGTSWNLKDLTTVEKYFNFADVKPGDWGEDTIGIQVNSNDAWVCAEITLTSNDENDAVDPEIDDGDQEGTADTFDGELAQNIEFIWWADDGDNVLEQDEVDSAYYLGPDTMSVLLGADNVLKLTLADSTLNFYGETGPLTGGQMYYVGKAWCFGEMALDPVTTGGGSSPVEDSGITCSGVNVDNKSQTDSLTADIKFTAVQYRNNESYLCPEHQ